SVGAWYSHLRGLIRFSHGHPPSSGGYEVTYTAVSARGRDPLPPARRSRISPPDPVAAPLKGSTVVGKLWVSALREITALMSRTVNRSGTSCRTGANCSMTGPSMKATLSRYSYTNWLGVAHDVLRIS